MDTELFMECEEEELEPWQQVYDSVEEDDDYDDDYGEPVEDSSSPLPASETPPPRTPPPPATPAPPVMLPPPPPPPPAAAVAAPSLLPAPVSAPPPLMARAPQAPPPLFLTQTAGGTFLLPAAPGAGSSQPFLLATQGFPVQTVMNRGAPLVLNLQPGQTVQPLTLIQSSSLGQLVRPSVGVSPVRTRPGPDATAAAQPGSAFTAMQLPATLTIRTSTPGQPVNLQMTQVGGAGALKLAGSPALPSGSANGVSRVGGGGALSSSLTPGSAPSVVPTTGVGRVVTVAAADPPRVVMSVEQFYYGTYEGDLKLRMPHPLGIQISTFTCQICSHLAENNLRFMQHMLQHSDLIRGGFPEDWKCCRFCYRQFSSPSHLVLHLEKVHGSAPSSSMCRICEWAFDNEPSFLNHMKSNHKPGEMPYVCQVCSYRSSFYSDVLQHFASFHRDSRFLLCVFCLKVTRHPVSYQQHLLTHQINQAFHCNKCRLQFIFLKDKMQHKLENHRSFSRPPQLEGLPPGSKVTIRTYGKNKSPMTSSGGRFLQTPSSSSSSPLVQPIVIKTEKKSPPLSKPPRSPNKRPFSRRLHASRSDRDHLLCLECGTDASNFSAHYPTHVRCLLCPYSSCCSRAYAAHMIHHHVPRSKDKAVPLHRRPPPCVFVLQCSECDFSPQSADQMAAHLLNNPTHHSATCRPRTAYVEPDIRFHQDGDSEQQRSSEETEPGQNQDLPDPSWRSAASWTAPAAAEEGVAAAAAIAPFVQSSGPHHSLAKNSDAIDYFNLLFPAALVELIATETNAHAKTCHFLGASAAADWVPVTTQEVKGFIGLVVLMGIQNLPDPAHYWSWGHYDNSYTFYRAMSLRRFKQIAANIRMGSATTERYRRAGRAAAPADPLHIFRPMLALVGGAMWDAYRPNACLAVDRALLPSLEPDAAAAAAAGHAAKGNAKTQPQVWLLCDSKSGYCHRFFIEAGGQQQGGGGGGQDPGFSVVPALMKGLEERHHQLYLSSALTSVPLMQKLLDQGVYASSSVPPHSALLPPQLWAHARPHKPGDFVQRQFGPLLATCWRDAKEMGCLSTNAAPGQPDTVWRRSQTKVGGLDPIERPMAFRLLQENMRGVDICKQLLACNPLGGVPQDRHWRSLFWFLVNLSIVNAFIVLRESRKENPPAWVQDGLFTQVNFRKRLGNQLAKCAQKYFETMEMASARGARAEPAEEPVKQRHRMAKISSISKRCKNCNLKNVRHESVYGCTVCKANLCKQPGCFWEFHGLPPATRGSTKVGFVKDRISGAVEMNEAQDGVDEAMAPVEDVDFSDEEPEDELDDADEGSEDTKEDVFRDVKHPVPLPPKTPTGRAAPAADSPATKEREDSLTARQLRITMFALCDGLRQASRVFSTEPQLIRAWMAEARRRLRRAEPERRADGEERMVAWLLSMREQQLPITESSFFNKASTLKKKGGFSDAFRISYDWAVGFLARHRLGVRTAGRNATLHRTLPAALDAKVKSFREFTHKVIREHRLPERRVAAVDELCLFVDLRLVQDKARRSEALELSGSLPLVTVYLAALADGTVLPSLVLANRRAAAKAPPAFVLLEDGLQADEALEVWTNKVWLQHAATGTPPGKSLLVSDRHRDHTGDQFLTAVSGAGTLPAVIPAGCSFCLQPLDVCVKPALQRFLLRRWERFACGNPALLDEDAAPQKLQAGVATLLVDWLVEALALLNTLPQVWKDSFRLTRLLLPPPSPPPRSSPPPSRPRPP